jgi:hypothetical protein
MREMLPAALWIRAISAMFSYEWSAAAAMLADRRIRRNLEQASDQPFPGKVRVRRTFDMARMHRNVNGR